VPPRLQAPLEVWTDEDVTVTATLVFEPLEQHLIESHTTIEQVGAEVAEPAGTKNLVLTHLLPENDSRDRWQRARRGSSGRLVIGEA
jgi:ribonuclease BN (tRNA processing enzyme)